MRPLKSSSLLLGLSLLTVACGDDDKPLDKTSDAGAKVDAESDVADAAISDCYDDASTNDELINACTDAEKVEKEPTLPLLLSDGGLPPLP